MKKRKADRGTRDVAALSTDFARGFVATGLLSVLQDRGAKPAEGLDARRALRHAMQGGAALAAGSLAAKAVESRDLSLALGALAAGVAAIYGIEQLLRPPRQVADGEV